jgi:nicotinate-nucleotide adenylyltransferase
MRIGILGGSFNPVHNGHLRLALEVMEQVPLDRVDLVPASSPPHKSGKKLFSFDFRCSLLEAVAEIHPELHVNPLEGKRQGPSYTVDTLGEYHRDSPESSLFFILGCSDFLTLSTWHEWQEIATLTNFAVTGRFGEGSEDLEEYIFQKWPKAWCKSRSPLIWELPGGKEVHYILAPRLDISASLIRQKLEDSLSLSFLVPEKVEQMLLG